MLTIGRLRVSAEYGSRRHLWPILKGRFERDLAAQNYYNCLWSADIHWMRWWVQIVIGTAND